MDTIPLVTQDWSKVTTRCLASILTQISYFYPDYPYSLHVETRHTQPPWPECYQVLYSSSHKMQSRKPCGLPPNTTAGAYHVFRALFQAQHLTKILLQVDWACLPPNPAPWSPALNQAYLRRRLWTVALSAHCNQRNMEDIISTLQAHLTPSPEDALELTHLISANLHHMQKALSTAKWEAADLWHKHLKAILNEASRSKPMEENASTNLPHPSGAKSLMLHCFSPAY